MNKVIILFLHIFRGDLLRFFFSGSLFEVVVLQLYEQVQSPPFNYDLYSGSHRFDS